jgi:CRISPR-associated protein (Cas_Cmr3)
MTGTAAHSLLFFLQVIRMKYRSGFAGWLDAALPPRLDAAALTSGIGYAGRSWRLITFEALPGSDLHWESLVAGEHLNKELSDWRHAWITLLTPARLEDALRLTLPSQNGVTVEIKSAFLGPPQVYGGYSITEGKTRKNHLYLPAGSSWLVELRGGRPEDRMRMLRNANGRHILGNQSERQFGFGQILVAMEDLEQEHS